MKCGECDTSFTPITDAYKCPLCGAENYPDDDYFDPGVVGDESEGECPSCGARLDYREVIPEADVGCNYCPECGYEGGVG